MNSPTNISKIQENFSLAISPQINDSVSHPAAHNIEDLHELMLLTENISSSNNQFSSLVPVTQQVDADPHKNSHQEEEIQIYSQSIGIDLGDPADFKLRWIAEVGLSAPLPDKWKVFQKISDGEIVYVNLHNGLRSASHPLDEYFKQLASRERFYISLKKG